MPVEESIKKRKKEKNFLRFFIVMLLIVLAGLVIFVIWNYNNFSGSKPGTTIILQNPMKDIVSANLDIQGRINQQAVIQQGVANFNESYILYLLAAMGVSSLHKSNMGYGNPKLEFILDSDVWNFEFGDSFAIRRGKIDGPDLIIRMKKEEAVKALLAEDVKQFMKDSAVNGDIQIEIVAGKVELFSKGYLTMYKELTGKDYS